MKSAILSWVLASVLLAQTALAAPSAAPVACPGAAAPVYPLVAASGWTATPVLGGLTTPRGIVVDTLGNLLVVQRGVGISVHSLDSNGCVKSTKTLVADTTLNHGIDVNILGNKLVASSADTAWSWDYNPRTQAVSNKKTLVTGMYNSYQVTRTVLFSKASPNLVLVSVGSGSDLDLTAASPSSGRASVRVFNTLTIPSSGVQFNSTSGKVLGYGLRNDVGLTEDRAGNIHSVENSVEDAYVTVNGIQENVHTDNPAEKVYKLGNPASPANAFGGYPYCLTVWESDSFINKQAGDWFAPNPTSTITDSWCAANSRSPTVLLPPHSAPLDLKFGLNSDSNLYIGMHGSVNSPTPVGYKVVAVPGKFSAGSWAPSGSLVQTKATSTDVLTNANTTACTGTSGCFRPVGLAFSGNGKNLYISSDVTGEVFRLTKTN